jgi:serine/threonine-protein kinase
MGTVYLAQRTEDYSQLVAIKVIHSTSRPDGFERFLYARQTMARLEHPNIARLLDRGIPIPLRRLWKYVGVTHAGK